MSGRAGNAHGLAIDKQPRRRPADASSERRERLDFERGAHDDEQVRLGQVLVGEIEDSARELRRT